MNLFGMKNMSPERHKQITEYLWLHYYNQVLLNKGVISQTDYDRMRRLILERSSR